MTLPRLDAISEHWRKVPPLSVSVAAIAAVLGATPAAKGPSKTDSEPKKPPAEQDPQALIDLLGGGGFSQGKPEWLKAAQATT